MARGGWLGAWTMVVVAAAGCAAEQMSMPMAGSETPPRIGSTVDSPADRATPSAPGEEPTRDPSDPYAPPADRIDPDVARTAGNAAFVALGESRSGVDGVGRVPATSNARYVSARDGDDHADGSAAAPWRTIQHAADAVIPDTTVYVDSSGDYAGGVVIARGGRAGRWVVFRNRDAGAAPRIVGGERTAVVRISASYVVFHGFEIADHDLGGLSEDDIGIEIVPDGSDVTQVQVSNNHIHDIGPANAGSGSCSYNGHGILAHAEGDGLSGIYVDANELEHLYVGNSECLVLNGNIDGFRVTNNYVHEVNNIAIDIIGYETGSETARNGLVADNVVLDASNSWPYCTRGNCTYARGDQSSNGIYVDGGADTVIEHNVVGRTDLGIELQSENGELIRNVEVRFNVVFNSNYTNWVLGPNDGCSEHDNALFDDSTLSDATFESCR